MPAWLLPPSTPPIPDKPDLIMLWRDNMILEHQKSLFHEEEEEYRKLEYKKPTRNKEKKLKIQELCYTSLPNNINKREQEKRDKYAPLLQRLKDKGYKPELYIIVLGTSGEITSYNKPRTIWHQRSAPGHTNHGTTQECHPLVRNLY